MIYQIEDNRVLRCAMTFLYFGWQGHVGGEYCRDLFKSECP